MKTVNKIARAKFKISTPNVPNSELELDFNPILQTFKLEGDYLLVHWQGHPKGHREWGIYSSVRDCYDSVIGIDFHHPDARGIQLNDKAAITKPSAVLLIKNARLLLLDDVAIICTKERLINVG